MGTNSRPHATNVSDFAALYPHSREGTESMADPVPSDQPLVLIYAWLYASPSAIVQYVNLYHDKGVDVLVIHGHLLDFFVVSKAIKLAEKLLNYLLYSQRYYKKYLVHVFSIGAFNFTMCLKQAKDHIGRYGAFIESIRGVIFDSAVIGSVRRMSRSISQVASQYYCVQWLAFRTALLYLTMGSKPKWEFYRNMYELITNAPVDKTALFIFSSQDDPMCDVSKLEDFIKKWQSENVSPVLVRHWPKSVHAAHLRFHRQEYLETWQTFCSVLPDFFQNSKSISKEKVSKL